MKVVLCFDDKENMQAFLSRRCVGPFETEATAQEWLEKHNEHHWVLIEMEKPE